MIETAMLGLDKTGLSNLGIERAHPGVEFVAGSDATTYVTDLHI